MLKVADKPDGEALISPRRCAASVLAVIGTSLALASGAVSSTAAQPAPAPVLRLPAAPTAPTGHRPIQPLAFTCVSPAPTTAAGYAAMFGRVDPTVWGAADTALSVAMPGRSVWIYSDTPYAKAGARYDVLSGWARMNHSSAIVQTRGCLHVAATRWHGQVLPDDPILRTFYWVDSATALNATQIRVVGYEMRQGVDWTKAWTGKFRAAVLDLRANGDLDWNRWAGYTAVPQPLLTKDDGYLGNSVSVTKTGQVVIPAVFPAWTAAYSYSPQAHPELRLASGKTLVSLAVGWSGDAPRTWAQWRPVYREMTLP